MLRITQATSPAPGAVNEDYVLSGPGWVAVLDGATAPRGVESGCVHGVPWLVRRLSTAIGAWIGEALTLKDVLAAAISDTRAAHGGLCDLGNPNSPSSTVALLRERGELLDYLVLCDSPVLIRWRDGRLTVVDDDRADRLPGGRPYTLGLVERMRNRPGGFWVASTDPGAAARALAGTVPAGEVDGAGLFTDGVTRLVHRYGRPWESLAGRDPAELIAEVRAAEHADTAGRPGKRHDDATAVWAVRP